MDRTTDLCDRYIDLLQGALLMSLWRADDGAMPMDSPLKSVARKVVARLSGRSSAGTAEPGLRDDGRDWPRLAHTMIGRKRMENLRFCVEDVIAKEIPGDFIETGVWRGGACIFMRGILAAHGVTDRRVWVADSFEGLPKPDASKYSADAHDRHHKYSELAISLDEVRSNFAQYGLLDDNVQFLKGWFKDTLPSAPIERLAVARLDGDMYESTMDALVNLYPKLSPGGYLIVDDYGAIPACKQAVTEYRAQHGIVDAIKPIDWTGAFWQKSA